MLGLISKLQKKPEETRRHFVLVATVLITAVIIIVWVSTLNPRVEVNRAEVSETISPISSFGSTFTQALEDVMEALPLADDFTVDSLEPSQEGTIPTTTLPSQDLFDVSDEEEATTSESSTGTSSDDFRVVE